jgi:hypothetical protein
MRPGTRPWRDMQVPLVLVNLHAAWERQVRAFRPVTGYL